MYHTVLKAIISYFSSDSNLTFLMKNKTKTSWACDLPPPTECTNQSKLTVKLVFFLTKKKYSKKWTLDGNLKAFRCKGASDIYKSIFKQIEFNSNFIIIDYIIYIILFRYFKLFNMEVIVWLLHFFRNSRNNLIIIII
jgi:hypothetical protein